MKPHSKTRRTYDAHRENQRERILEAAETLFIRHGIDNVSISDIAGTARISRVTLYGYFPNKAEITWAIFQKLVEGQRMQRAGEPEWQAGSGFQRVERLMTRAASMLETHPEHLRFIVEFNTLYAREGNPARVRQIIEQSGAGGHNLLASLIREGIDDGSIRPEVDAGLLSAALMNMLNAMNSRFALLGDQIREEFGYPVMDMYREICQAFLRGIQNPLKSQENNE